MRIIQWAHSLSGAQGGIEEFVAALSSGLVENGHSIFIVTSKSDQLRAVTLDKYKSFIPTHFIDIEGQESGSDPAKSLRDNWFALQHMVRATEPDLIHLHSFGRGDVVFLAQIAKQFKIPVVVTIHWLVEEHEFERLFSPVGHFACAIIAPSNFIRGKLEQLVPQWSARLETIRNGVSEMGTPPRHYNKGQIFASGRHVSEKGFSNLIAALPIVLLRDPKAQLVLAGSGPETKGLKRLAKMYRVDHAIQWTGWLPRNRAIQVAQESAVVVVPSLWEEPFGLVAAEAAMAGTPVVGTRIGGLPEIVVSGRTGLLYPPGDIPYLGVAISHILKHPRIREAFSIAGHQHAIENFGLTRNVSEHIELYEAAISGVVR